MTAAGSPPQPIRVLLSLAAPDGTTKFVDQIVRYPADGVRFRFFTWRAALFGRYDVFHVHWPEALARARGRIRTAVKRVLFLLLLARLAVSRTPVVRTVHNLEPHRRGGPLERRLTDRLDRRVVEYIVLNDVTPSTGRPVTRIPHGDYREVFAGLPRATRAKGRLLTFGRIERYKGVDLLVRAFREHSDPGRQLVVVGRADEDVRLELEGIAERDPRVTFRFEFVSDEIVVSEVSRASAVVLPYRELHNSGVLLVALSIGTRAVALRTPATEEIQREVGEDWLQLFEGEFGPTALEAALEWADSPCPGHPPALAGRDWRAIGAAHRAVYARALRSRGERR